MSEDDSEEMFCHFGTALDIDEEDEESRRRKLPSDFRERVLDEKGRPLRFHGAFTGGFSAGHFNTVGSQDGFIPASFYSSRKRASENESGSTRQKPEDFMDESDFSDFGIAPRSVRVANKFDSSEFNSAVKKSLGSIGTISASYNDPLKDIIAPKMATVSQRLIKRMFRSDNKTDEIDSGELTSEFQSGKVSSVMYTELDFASMQKENTYGFGYKPLTSDLHKRNDQSSHLTRSSSSFVDSLFPEYKSIGRGIRGSGFGVGIQEEQDEDVYHNDDWSNYDFAIASDSDNNELTVKERSGSIPYSSKTKSALSMFKVGSTVSAKKYPLPHLPRDFNPVFKRPTKVIQSKRPPVPVVQTSEAPTNVTEWEKPLEKKTTLPSWTGQLSKKFHSVGADAPIGSSQKPKLCLDEPKVLSELDLTVKLQNYGLLTRSTLEWRPDNLLCKRFNVPNPYPDSSFTGVPSDTSKRDESFNVSNPTFSISKMIEECSESLSKNTSESQSNLTDNIPCGDAAPNPEIQKSSITIKPSSRKGNIFSVLFDNNETSQQPETPSNDKIVTDDSKTTPANDILEQESISAPVGVPPRPLDLFKSIFASDDDSDYPDSEEDKDDQIEADIISKMNGPNTADIISSSALAPGSEEPSVNESVNRILSAVHNFMDKKSSGNLNSANTNHLTGDSSSDLEFIEVTKSSLTQKKKKSKRKKTKKTKKERKKKKKRDYSSSDSS